MIYDTFQVTDKCNVADTSILCGNMLWNVLHPLLELDFHKLQDTDNKCFVFLKS